MLVTDAVFQIPIGWLNAVAPANIPCIVLTAVVVQFARGWLKLEQPLNTPCICVTCAVFQPLMSWLNAVQPLNIKYICVTCEVSHFVIFPLNTVSALFLVTLVPGKVTENASLISVIKDVFQLGIVPYCKAPLYPVHSPVWLTKGKTWPEFASVKQAVMNEYKSVLVGIASNASTTNDDDNPRLCATIASDPMHIDIDIDIADDRRPLLRLALRRTVLFFLNPKPSVLFNSEWDSCASSSESSLEFFARLKSGKNSFTIIVRTKLCDSASFSLC